MVLSYASKKITMHDNYNKLINVVFLFIPTLNIYLSFVKQFAPKHKNEINKGCNEELNTYTNTFIRHITSI